MVDFKHGSVYRAVAVSYETLRKHAAELAGCVDLLVCDEGHRWEWRHGNHHFSLWPAWQLACLHAGAGVLVAAPSCHACQVAACHDTCYRCLKQGVKEAHRFQLAILALLSLSLTAPALPPACPALPCLRTLCSPPQAEVRPGQQDHQRAYQLELPPQGPAHRHAAHRTGRLGRRIDSHSVTTSAKGSRLHRNL